MLPHVILGGGIAGASCAEGLSQISSRRPIVLISATKDLRVVANVEKISTIRERFDVRSQNATDFEREGLITIL